jgi:GAF domain-containing protein/HAMP domain-containing protein
MRAARRGLQRVQGFDQAYYIVYSPLENTPWSLASVIAEKEVLASVFTLQADLQTVTQNQILTRVLPAIFLLFVLLIVVGIALTNRLVTPLETLADAAQSTAASWDDAHRQVQAAPTASVSPLQELAQRRDEIGSLAAAMQQLTRRFELRLEAQNVRLDEQNSVLLQGSKQVQIALEVGRSISDQDAHPPELSSGQTNAADLQKMLFEAVNLIADSFEFYNVGLFLIDESHGLAILHAASGDVGAQLVSKMLKLRVGQQGMVGYVTSQGQARVAEDVQEDRTYQPEPLLPETRSEAAFPLRAGKRVIGALDVQSNRLEAFDDFTVMGLQNVADHLAGVIYRMQQRIAFQQAGGDAGRASIAKAALPASHLGFEYNPSLALLSGGVREIFEPVSDVPFYPAQGAASESQGALNAFDLSSPLAQQGILHVPVRLRDEVIGFIRLESEDSGHVWTADELAIAEATANQAALSVENARLLAETRRRAELEQAAAEITAQMRASLDLDTVLQTVVQQIALRMNLDNVEIRLAALQPAGELELGHTSPGDPESELREC